MDMNNLQMRLRVFRVVALFLRDSGSGERKGWGVGRREVGENWNGDVWYSGRIKKKNK